jgi:solute carrier family 25 phosphate transporter 23/24/25/41
MDTNSASVADARVDELWATLDTRKQGHLDLPALKKGLRKLDHRRVDPPKITSMYPAKRIL